MYSLSPRDEHRFAPDVWVLDLARTPTGGLVSISSDQSLSLLDPADLGRGPVRRLATGHGNLTTLRVFGESVVCTAGEDGGVEVWDVRAASRVAQFRGEFCPTSLSRPPPGRGTPPLDLFSLTRPRCHGAW